MTRAPVAQKLTLKSEVPFDFDRSVIKPGDRAKLDDVAGKAENVKLEVLIASGHTDPIGGSEYNQKLSVRRADAVKARMASKGIDPNRIYAEGKGKTQQVKACPKNLNWMALVACLAPNRRVEIAIVGTR